MSVARSGDSRASIVAEIEAMDQDAEVRRRAVAYLGRMTLYDAVNELARRDLAREWANATIERAVEETHEPTTWRDLWEVAADLCRDNAYALFLVPLGVTLAAWGLMDWLGIAWAAWGRLGQ